MKKQHKLILGTLLLITAFAFGWIWFGFKLSLVIFLALTGNNLERRGNE